MTMTTTTMATERATTVRVTGRATTADLGGGMGTATMTTPALRATAAEPGSLLIR